MRILLTNDDGITAPGLIALYRAIASLGEVHVVAPADVQSATSHAITFQTPIKTRRCCVRDEQGRPVFEGVAVHGWPADCTKLAMAQLVRPQVDLVISGMNAGANIGINVIYSGTVAAAREAAFLGVPAIAVSLHIGEAQRTPWDAAAAQARCVIDRVLNGPLERHTLLNVNIPIMDDGQEPAGLRVVPISTSPIVDSYSCDEGDDGVRHFRCVGHLNFHHTPPDSDVEALFQRYITLTPLHYDLTHQPHVERWAKHVG